MQVLIDLPLSVSRPFLFKSFFFDSELFIPLFIPLNGNQLFSIPQPSFLILPLYLLFLHCDRPLTTMKGIQDEQCNAHASRASHPNLWFRSAAPGIRVKGRRVEHLRADPGLHRCGFFYSAQVEQPSVPLEAGGAHEQSDNSLYQNNSNFFLRPPSH